jgi:Integrase core domain
MGHQIRPIKPRLPHLNGKVERTQRADLEEFWATADLKSVDLRQRRNEWQHFWNWHRAHTSLGGRSPIDRVCELTAITPSAEAVDVAYNPAKERIRVSVTDTSLTPLHLNLVVIPDSIAHRNARGY